MTSRHARWRLDLAQQAIRTAEKHLDAGRMDHFRRSVAFAREMLKDEDVDDYEAAKEDGRVMETKAS